MPWVAIGLGSNLGNREALLLDAADSLRRHPGIYDFRLSRLYETEPVGGPPQGKFLNAAAAFRTEIEPMELLALLQSIERKAGRTREISNGPRTLDLDILLYGQHRIDLPQLRVPHPRMWEREFVLGPLTELLGAGSS